MKYVTEPTVNIQSYILGLNAMERKWAYPMAMKTYKLV